MILYSWAPFLKWFITNVARNLMRPRTWAFKIYDRQDLESPVEILKIGQGFSVQALLNLSLSNITNKLYLLTSLTNVKNPLWEKRIETLPKFKTGFDQLLIHLWCLNYYDDRGSKISGKLFPSSHVSALLMCSEISLLLILRLIRKEFIAGAKGEKLDSTWNENNAPVWARRNAGSDFFVLFSFLPPLTHISW